MNRSPRSLLILMQGFETRPANPQSRSELKSKVMAVLISFHHYSVCVLQEILYDLHSVLFGAQPGW